MIEQHNTPTWVCSLSTAESVLIELLEVYMKLARNIESLQMKTKSDMH